MEFSAYLLSSLKIVLHLNKSMLSFLALIFSWLENHFCVHIQEMEAMLNKKYNLAKWLFGNLVFIMIFFNPMLLQVTKQAITWCYIRIDTFCIYSIKLDICKSSGNPAEQLLLNCKNTAPCYISSQSSAYTGSSQLSSFTQGSPPSRRLVTQRQLSYVTTAQLSPSTTTLKFSPHDSSSHPSLCLAQGDGEKTWIQVDPILEAQATISSDALP